MNGVDGGAALCAPFLAGLPVTGVSISVVSTAGAQSTVGASDSVAARLEELQFELGEGPTPDLLRGGIPILIPDLLADEVRREWPVFGVAAVSAGASALFSFPLLAGVSTVGVVSLYSAAVAPPWPAGVMRTAVDLTAAAVGSAMALAARSANEEVRRPGRVPVELRREVHQASGMLMVQLDCSIGEALSRLRAHAFAAGRPVDAVARDVVAGTLDFELTDD